MPLLHVCQLFCYIFHDMIQSSLHWVFMGGMVVGWSARYLFITESLSTYWLDRNLFSNESSKIDIVEGRWGGWWWETKEETKEQREREKGGDEGGNRQQRRRRTSWKKSILLSTWNTTTAATATAVRNYEALRPSVSSPVPLFPVSLSLFFISFIFIPSAFFSVNCFPPPYSPCLLLPLLQQNILFSFVAAAAAATISPSFGSNITSTSPIHHFHTSLPSPLQTPHQTAADSSERACRWVYTQLHTHTHMFSKRCMHPCPFIHTAVDLLACKWRFSVRSLFPLPFSSSMSNLHVLRPASSELTCLLFR